MHQIYQNAIQFRRDHIYRTAATHVVLGLGIGLVIYPLLNSEASSILGISLLVATGIEHLLTWVLQK